MIKQDKKFYTKWWFWVIMAVVFLGVLGLVSPDNCEECEICRECEVCEDYQDCEICKTCEVCEDNLEYEQEPISQKDWHYTTSFNGVSDKTTDTFEIKGNKFKLTYIVNPANDYSFFSIFVYEEGNDMFVDFFTLDAGTETTIVYEGSGTYYLDIGVANLDSWSMKVEDYY